MDPLKQIMMSGPIGRGMDQLTDLAGLGLLKIMKPLGLIQINHDIHQVPYERARVLWQEALDRGIDFAEIRPFGRAIDLYCAKIHDKNSYFISLPRVENMQTNNLSWIDDKLLLKKKLQEHGLPVPRGHSLTTFSAALKEFEKLDKPVIVKPRAGSRGRHTTTLVYDAIDLRKAFRIAKQICHWVIVEEHLFGDVQRGTVIGGQLVGVLGGSPPRITGDGQHSVAELIKLKDSTRPDKVKEIKVNPYFMQRQNITMDTVLSASQTVDLSEKIGVNYGGASYDCTPECHPDTKQMFVDAANMLDISIIGFDFIIPDITKSWKVQKCGIIEANGAPFIQLHHDPLIGQSINAAKYVWDLVLQAK